MIPKNIKNKYNDCVDNPYRKLFVSNDAYAACDFSDLIPSYFLEISENCNADLINQFTDYAEKRNYFSFYILSKSVAETTQLFTATNYTYTVEETVMANCKSLNLLFWDWLFDTKNVPFETYVLKFSLPQIYR